MIVLLYLINNWYFNIDKGMINLIVFFDFVKVFDIVLYNILLKKFEFYGLKGVMFYWFLLYLLGR